MWPHCQARTAQARSPVRIAGRKGMAAMAAVPLLVLLAAAPAGLASIDVRVSSVAYTAQLPGPVASEALPVLVTITNDGTDPTPSFNVNVWKNRSTAPTTASGSDQQQTVSSLASHTDQTLEFDLTYDQPGTYFFWVLVDAANAVQEVTKENNVYSIVIAVSESAPDVIIESIVPSTDTPATGQAFTVAVTVKNQGRQSAGPFNVALFKNGASAPASAAGSDADLVVTGLSPGETTVVNLDVTYDAAGDYTFWAMADSGAAIAESDESNNAASVVFTIADGSGGGGGKGCGKHVGPANMVGFYVLCFGGLALAKCRRHE